MALVSDRAMITSHGSRSITGGDGRRYGMPGTNPVASPRTPEMHGPTGHHATVARQSGRWDRVGSGDRPGRLVAS